MTFLSDEASDRIGYWLERERAERHSAAQAGSQQERDDHFMMAERCADQAWSLGEEDGATFVPSSLWEGAATQGQIAA